MKFMDGDLKKYMEELRNGNLYGGLDYDEKEKIENELQFCLRTLTNSIENMIKGKYQGLDLKIDYADECFNIYSELLENEKYRGRIVCSQPMLVAMYQMFYGMDYSNIVPDGKNIGNIKKILFTMSMMYMFYHEIAHIYRGHLGLYSQWDEEEKKEHYLDIQTMEWDADSYAATQMAGWVLNIQKEVLPLDDTDFALKILCGIIHGTMYWQRGTNDFCNIDSKEHPPIFLREVAVLQSVIDICGNRDKMISYVIFYEKEFNKMRKMQQKDIGEYFKNVIENRDINEELRKRWMELEPELKKYALFPLKDLFDKGNR